MKRKEHYFGLALIISALLFHILTLPGCAPTKVKLYPKETQTEITSPGRPFPGKTYAEAISQWKSHEDLVKWMERDFSLDMERYKGFKGTLPIKGEIPYIFPYQDRKSTRL